MRIILSILYAPLIFLGFKYFEIDTSFFLTLKIFPLSMSIIVTFLILISYFKKDSMILKFAKRFTKIDISEEEKVYIHNSTLFWVFVSSVNIVIHIFMYLSTNIELWVFYSSVGWYGVFIVGAILQLLHRQFIFKKRQ